MTTTPSPPHAFWQRWGPGLLSTPLLLAAYGLLAWWAPAWLTSAGGWLAAVSLVSVLVCLVLGLVGRWRGWYAPDASGQPRMDPRRQAFTATQLALLLSWPIFAARGSAPSLLTFLVAFILVAALGHAALAWAGGQARPPAESAAPPASPAADPTTPPTRSRVSRVAPRWVQRCARLCLSFGILALFRLLMEQDLTYLWVGLVLISLALLGPSLVVALGGGVPAQEAARRHTPSSTAEEGRHG